MRLSGRNIDLELIVDGQGSNLLALLLDEDACMALQIRRIPVHHGEVIVHILLTVVHINPFGKVCGNGCMGAQGGENRNGENVAGKVLSLHGRTSNSFGKPVPTVGT